MKRARRAAGVAAVVPAVVGPAVAAACDGGAVLVAGMLCVAFVVAVVGAVVTLAVPGNRVGWLLLAAAFTAARRPGAAAGLCAARTA